MPVASANLEQLAQLVGVDKLHTDTDACERFRVDGVAPAAVVERADTKELVEIVRWARAQKAALMPVGSGAYLPLGNPPTTLDVAVCLRRFNRVLHYDPGDLTLSVEAGLPLARAKELLAEDKLILPADPPYADSAALGGLVATNASGPLRYAYGTWRDFVVGMKLITGEGKLIKTGGRVVKNVAGYDLTKLLIGSLGSLGIITEINFKLFPAPPAAASFVFGFETMEAALETARRIVHSPWQPRALELLDPGAARLLTSLQSAAHSLSPAAPAVGKHLSVDLWSLVVAVGGAERVVERYQADFNTLAKECKAASFTVARHEENRSLWGALRGLCARIRETNPAAAVVKCPLPLTQLGPFISKALQVAARYELPSTASAHAGSGIVYIYLLPGTQLAPSHTEGRIDQAEPARRSPLALSGGEGKGVGGPPHMTDLARRTAQAATEMIHAGNNLGGRVTIPWCPTEVKRDVNVWGPLRDDFPLMQKLKAQFDPDRILNPGRFVGGL